MPKLVPLGDDDKQTVKQELIDNKEIVRDNLKRIAQGGNFPDTITNLSEGETAIELLRANQIIFAEALIYFWKEINIINREIFDLKQNGNS